MAGIHTHKPEVPKGTGIWPETLMFCGLSYLC